MRSRFFSLQHPPRIYCREAVVFTMPTVGIRRCMCLWPPEEQENDRSYRRAKPAYHVAGDQDPIRQPSTFLTAQIGMRRCRDGRLYRSRSSDNMEYPISQLFYQRTAVTWASNHGTAIVSDRWDGRATAIIVYVCIPLSERCQLWRRATQRCRRCHFQGCDAVFRENYRFCM